MFMKKEVIYIMKDKTPSYEALRSERRRVGTESVAGVIAAPAMRRFRLAQKRPEASPSVLTKCDNLESAC